jgi:hypothetical protein
MGVPCSKLVSLKTPNKEHPMMIYEVKAFSNPGA